MATLVVTEAKCTRCGECAADCPARVISMPDGGLPRYAEGGGGRCYLCGHCEAVCPAGAIAVEDPRLDPRTYPAGEAPLPPGPLEDHLRMRRSVRRYEERPVDRETLGRLMDVVRYAPSGVNRQALRWIVVVDAKEVRRLAGIAIDWMREAARSGSPLSAWLDFSAMVAAWERGTDPVLRHAPHLVVAHAHAAEPTAPGDAFIALAHLDAFAPSLGLGSCWAGLFQIAASQHAPLREALTLPADHVPLYAMMLGIPAVRYRRPPKRNRAEIEWR